MFLVLAQISAPGPLSGTTPQQPIFVNVSPPSSSPEVAAILGALVGGGLAVLGQYVAHKLSERRESEKARRDAEIQREVDILTALERFTTTIGATARAVANLMSAVAILRQPILEGDDPADVSDLLDNVLETTTAFQDAKGPLLGQAAAFYGAVGDTEPELVAAVQRMVHAFMNFDIAVGEIPDDVTDTAVYDAALAAYQEVELAIASAPTLYFQRRARPSDIAA